MCQAKSQHSADKEKRENGVDCSTKPEVGYSFNIIFIILLFVKVLTHITFVS